MNNIRLSDNLDNNVDISNYKYFQYTSEVFDHQKIQRSTNSAPMGKDQVAPDKPALTRIDPKRFNEYQSRDDKGRIVHGKNSLLHIKTSDKDIYVYETATRPMGQSHVVHAFQVIVCDGSCAKDSTPQTYHIYVDGEFQRDQETDEHKFVPGLWWEGNGTHRGENALKDLSEEPEVLQQLLKLQVFRTMMSQRGRLQEAKSLIASAP